jgi:hypothetical protein
VCYDLGLEHAHDLLLVSGVGVLSWGMHHVYGTSCLACKIPCRSNLKIHNRRHGPYTAAATHTHMPPRPLTLLWCCLRRQLALQGGGKPGSAGPDLGQGRNAAGVMFLFSTFEGESLMSHPESCRGHRNTSMCHDFLDILPRHVRTR